MQPDTNERIDARHDAAQTWAEQARERALAAREAAEQATTEYARRAHQRVADLDTELAHSHEEPAQTLRFGGGREEV